MSGGLPSGSVNRKSPAPLAVLPRRSCLLCASMIARLIARPSPTPGVDDLRVPRGELLEDRTLLALSVCRQPASLTLTRRFGRHTGRNGRSSRFPPACICMHSRSGYRGRVRSASHRTRPAEGRAADRARHGGRRARAARPERALPTTSSIGCHCRRSFTSPLSMRAISSRVVDQRTHAPRFLGDRLGGSELVR